MIVLYGGDRTERTLLNVQQIIADHPKEGLQCTNDLAVSMDELERESAELLPSRETLYCCGLLATTVATASLTQVRYGNTASRPARHLAALNGNNGNILSYAPAASLARPAGHAPVMHRRGTHGSGRAARTHLWVALPHSVADARWRDAL